MQAVVIISSTDGGTLAYRDIPDPTPRPGSNGVQLTSSQRWRTGAYGRCCTVSFHSKTPL
jgi:hypothetical protein